MTWYDGIRDRIFGSSSDRTSEEMESQENDRRPPASSGGFSKGKPRSETIERVDPAKLEKYYYFEPIAYAGVNFYSYHVTGESFMIQGQKDNDVHRIRDFLENVRFKQKLNAVMRDLGIFGNSFMEIVWQKNGEKIVDLAHLDPKNVEFIKREKGTKKEVAVDKGGDPIGYIQKISMGDKDRDKYKEIAESFDQIDYGDLKVEKGIPFHRDEIVHFKLQNLSSSLMGVGLIEPVYPTITIKLNAEEMLEEGLQKGAMSELVGEVGSFDDNEPVSSSDTSALTKKLEAMRREDFGVISVPNYYSIDSIETDPGGMEEYFRMFQDLIIVGMGLPPGLLSRGADVGSSIAEIQHALTERVMSSFQKSLSRDCEDQLFTMVLDKDSSEVPRITWEELNPLTKGKKARRIGELMRAGGITRDRGLEEHLRDLEDLPPLPEETEDEKKEREKEGREKQDRAKSRSNRERI